MEKNFWKKLKKPILALAPLAGVTDSAFRQICKKFGAQAVYSEMASAAALCHGSGETLELLKFSKSERPYVVQLFGSDPKQMGEAAKIVTAKIKPDGIDINFGCPVKKVMKQGAGAALFKDLERSRAVIEAVLKNTDLPVSIKVRTQSGPVKLREFLQNISDLKIAALMIHGRTLSQGFSGPIDADAIKDARRYFSGIILANGGIDKPVAAKRVLTATKADGLGIGRGALGRPWLFREILKTERHRRMRSGKILKKPRRTLKIPAGPREIFKIALAQARLAAKLKGRAGILEMRKQLCWYAAGLPGARQLREKLVKVETLDDIKAILK